MKEEMNPFKVIGFGLAGLFVFVFLIGLYSDFVSPSINVYKERLHGQAELARAESNRQITTLEALAKKESSKALADAEVIRAEGVAKANKIIGASLEDNEGYLRYLYINHLSETNDKTVIYIPTEAGLPILEANRFLKEK